MNLRRRVARSVALAAGVAATALMVALPANADPADPDPFSPGDCMASAKANCSLFGPYGLNDHDKSDHPPGRP